MPYAYELARDEEVQRLRMAVRDRDEAIGELLDLMDVRGCVCDPPGSGEEYCVGTCRIVEF